MEEKVLALTTDQGIQTGRSGYPILFDYMRDNVEHCRVPRSSNRIAERIARRSLRTVSASSWYEFSSLQVEFHALIGSQKIVHVSWADRDWGLVDSVAWLRNKQLIGTFHVCPDEFDSVLRFPKRLNRFSAIILMSETQREHLLNLGVQPEKLFVVQHGIDTSYFHPPATKPTNSRIRFFHVGGYRRDFDTLLETCKLIESRHVPVDIQLLGPPHLTSPFSRFESVTILPRISDEQLLREYQHADALLMTAKAATANNALLEGMSCGLPIVSQNVGGIPEYTDEECALLASAEDPRQLAFYIETLASKSELRKKMGEASRKRALTLDWKKIASQTLDIYQQVSEGKAFTSNAPSQR